MTRDEALEKVKKCLALAASSNPHEAAAAMRQTQKLMAQHGLDEQDVSLSDVAECAQDAYNLPHVRWESHLSNIVADAFGCVVHTGIRLSLKGHLHHKRVRTYTFTGVGPAAEVAGYAFTVLSRQCAKGRRAHIKQQPKNCKPKTKVARGDAYADGWVFGVAEKLEQFAAKPEHTQLVKAYLEKKYPNMGESKPKDRTAGKNVSYDDQWHGIQAGRKAELHTAVNGAAARPALGVSS